MMIIIITANNKNNFTRRIPTLILDVRSALSVEGGNGDDDENCQQQEQLYKKNTYTHTGR